MSPTASKAIGGSDEPAVVPRGRPTIYDVADRAGVSKSLVSLVLRGSPNVSPVRRDAVLTAIRELGYRPSQAATVLASRRTQAIQVVIDDYRNLWFVDLLDGLRKAFDGRGYRVSVIDRTGDNSGAASAPLAAGIDGLVMACDPGDGLLTGWNGPTVMAGWREGTLVGADQVANDDELGSRLAVAHLAELGHREIGHLSGGGGAAGHRRKGFTEAVAAAGLAGHVSEGLGGTTEEDGYHAAEHLLRRQPDLTAVYAANDSMAVGALAAFKERGLTVPADISLVGYDDSPLAKFRYIDLTSVDDKSTAVGQAAGRALLMRIDEPHRPVDQVLIEPALVARGSSGPARR
ncbi:LacI family DNA-binding transcriptional regulator [Nakamurella sp. GG22]